MANGLSVANFKDESGEKSSCYWVRDEAKNPYNASCVFDNGSANNVGISYSNGRVGIRPAMWVRIK